MKKLWENFHHQITEDYLYCQIIGLNIIDKFLVSPNSFFPKPKVNSLVIHFNPKKRMEFKIKEYRKP